MYPEKRFHSILEEHVKKFVPYSGKCEDRLHYRSKDKDKPWGVATIFLDPLVKNLKKINEIEKDRFKSRIIDKLTVITHNSIKKFNPIFYKNHIPKPNFITKILHLIDRSLDNFKHWACNFICVKSPCSCENNNSVSRYVCFKLYS